MMDQLFLYVLHRYLLLLMKAAIILLPLFFVFWIWKPAFLQPFRIPLLVQAKPIWGKELARSIFSLAFYMIPVFFVALVAKKYGYSMMYTDIDTYGILYLPFAYLIYVAMYDTGFYWSHRLLHHRRMYKKSHALHHQSLNVNPLSSYSFDPIEAVVNTIPLALFLFLIPWHPMLVLFISILGPIHNGYIHLGYDFLPKNAANHPIWKWIYSARHHSLHHQRFNCNYGLYFTFWDKMMRTEKIFEAEQQKSYAAAPWKAKPIKA